jgi:phosphate starvation-inducible PhoH-like protein
MSTSKQVVVGKRSVTPKTLNQKLYLDAIEKNDLIFGIGPAGPGKTYLAVSMAVRALLEKRVNRIVLTRPAVEAGERLGFLPGTLQEKIDPYLKPSTTRFMTCSTRNGGSAPGARRHRDRSDRVHAGPYAQ